MFRAIGVVIVVYAISTMMGTAFRSFESAATAVFGSFEAAALTATEQFDARH